MQENIQAIKKQIITEIEKSLKGEQKEQLISEIKKMSAEELEEFLKKNNLLKDNEKCIFCSIVDGDIPTYKLIENDYAIATLDINPISKGHTLVIPKAHSKDTPKQAKDLASEISEHLKFLNPKTIEIIPTEIFGHSILNVFPVYTNETIKSKRKKATEAHLKALQEHLREQFQQKKEKPIEKKEIKKQEIISDETHWLPKRFP